MHKNLWVTSILILGLSSAAQAQDELFSTGQSTPRAAAPSSQSMSASQFKTKVKEIGKENKTQFQQELKNDLANIAKTTPPPPVKINTPSQPAQPAATGTATDQPKSIYPQLNTEAAPEAAGTPESLPIATGAPPPAAAPSSAPAAAAPAQSGVYTGFGGGSSGGGGTTQQKSSGSGGWGVRY